MSNATPAHRPAANGRPELSVVIPAYNAIDTLSTQLAALLDQRPTWPWEVLVCDNGSTDETVELVRSWAERMPELRLVDASARRGPAAARNIGVAASISPRIAFCDADDRVGDGWVDVVRSALDQHEFIAGPFEGELLNSAEGSVTWTTQTHGLTVKPSLPQFVTAGSGNMGVLRSVFEEVGGFYEGARTAEDDDFCIRVQLAGHELVFVSDMLLHVRRRSGLWHVYRQAYAYGAGERKLMHRYAALVPSDDESPKAPSTPTSPHEPESHLVAAWRRVWTRTRRIAWRIADKAKRTRRPGDFADTVWRVGWALGWRFTRPDASTPPIRPDDPATLRADFTL